jgi:hypothetical protein
MNTMDKRDLLLAIAPPAMFLVVTAVFIWAMASVFSALEKESREVREESERFWQGSEIVRVCRDGTRIHRVRGHLYDRWRNRLSGEPKDICD